MRSLKDINLGHLKAFCQNFPENLGSSPKYIPGCQFWDYPQHPEPYPIPFEEVQVEHCLQHFHGCYEN